jgi:hypothetical protein
VVTRVLEPFDEARAVERMVDDGSPTPAPLRVRKPPSPLQLRAEPTASERAAQRKAARSLLRLVCLACGRATEPTPAPARGRRCPHCGGTMLLELAND